MYNKYELQLEILVSERSEERVIQIARRVYSERGGATEGSGQSACQISAEEFIDGVQDALIELLEGNSRLQDAGIEIHSIKCSSGEPIRAA